MTHPAAAPPPPPPRFDVLGLGNAIVDVLATVAEAEVERLGLAKGTMTLVDAERSAELYAAMGPAREASGGSCANTVAALASLGGSAAYVGRVRDDQLGEIFAHDMRAAGISFESRPASSGPPTARSLIFVTPDAQRTMQTYLGACVELGPEDVDGALAADAAVTYLEGYLWDRPGAKAACRKAAAAARAAGRKVALSLSDPFCVERWRAEFRELVAGEVDILLANEAEATALYESPTFAAALRAARADVATVALTRGAAGSVVADGGGEHAVAAAPVPRLVDTTGAGDLYAAGLLRGLTAGLPLPACGRLGSLAAASVLGIVGPRPPGSLAPLFARVAAGE